MVFSKIVAAVAVAVLCLFFGAFGQGKVAVDVTAGGLKVGDVVPDVLVSGVYNYKGVDGGTNRPNEKQASQILVLKGLAR